MHKYHFPRRKFGCNRVAPLSLSYLVQSHSYHTASAGCVVGAYQRDKTVRRTVPVGIVYRTRDTRLSADGKTSEVVVVAELVSKHRSGSVSRELRADRYSLVVTGQCEKRDRCEVDIPEEFCADLFFSSFKCCNDNRLENLP